MGITAAIRAIAILVIVVIIAAAGWYVTSLKADLAVSLENTKKMTDAVQAQQELITQIKAEQAAINKINSELTGVIKAQQQDMNSLRDRFNTSADGTKRDFGKLAAEKPAIVEKAINTGTKNALRCIELASGSPLTEGEKNGTETNKECPSLLNPTTN